MKQITSLQHPLVHYWKELKQKSSFRREQKRLLLEGRNAIQDVCKKFPAKRLIITNPAFENEVPAEETILVSEQILKKISSVETNGGILVELEAPELIQLQGRKIVVCDRIQDPGNLGTLIRSCLAFGWDSCALLPGCVDPFNDKVLRASKGAVFFLPLCQTTWSSIEQYCKEHGIALIVAVTKGKTPELFVKEQPKALVLGNEAHWASPPDAFAHEKVAICMPGPVESLNVAVAGSILLYLL